MEEQTRTQTINGVDVSKLKETIKAVKQTPSLADFRFRIVNKWQGGGLNQTKPLTEPGRSFPTGRGSSLCKPMNHPSC